MSGKWSTAVTASTRKFLYSLPQEQNCANDVRFWSIQHQEGCRKGSEVCRWSRDENKLEDGVCVSHVEANYQERERETSFEGGMAKKRDQQPQQKQQRTMQRRDEGKDGDWIGLPLDHEI